MEGDALVPSLSEGSVGSRFVSEVDIDAANKVREEQWKAAYARIGQAPPKKPDEDANYDGRSLYEKLATNKAAKQEEWEEKNKLSNQFRALEEEEVRFLDSIKDKQQEQEKKRKEVDGEEVRGFKAAIAARDSAAAAPPPLSTILASTSSKPKTTTSSTKVPAKAKAGLKGVVVTKKKSAPKPSNGKPPADNNKAESPKKQPQQPQDSEPDAKRRRLDAAS